MVILLVAILSDTIIVIGKYIFQKLLAKMGPLCFLSPLVSSLKGNYCDHGDCDSVDGDFGDGDW